MKQKIKLQPLRIPNGWKISWNKFYEIDPPETFSDEYYDYFDVDMFFAMYLSRESGGAVGIDLSFQKADGKYILSVVHYTEVKFRENVKQTIKVRKEGQTLSYRLEPNLTSDPANWENAVLKTRSRIEIVEKMDEILWDVMENLSSKYWKRGEK